CGSLIAAACPGHAGAYVSVHQDRKVRPESATKRFMTAQHTLAAKLTASPLIGLGGVGEAVTEYPLPCLQRRQNDFLNLLRARGEHERHLGVGVQSGGA